MVGVGGSKPLVPTIFYCWQNIMLKISLPNGSQLEFDSPVTVKDISEKIGPRLAKAAIAAKIDSELVDLSYQVKKSSAVVILTPSDSEGLEVLRHSCAHLLAQAVLELFPDAQPTVGPSIEDGFYHDFYYPKGFSQDDLEKIEARMHEIAKRGDKITRSVKGRKEAIELFANENAAYRVKMVEDIPEGEEISFYSQGDFINVCRGPHVPNTSYLKAFKLTKVSGAYWHGNSKNEMLQRIYGTIWETEKELKGYIERIEKAKQRDHRIIGKKMDLFHLQEEAPGMVFWHPKGWRIYTEIKKHLMNRLEQFGYQEINTPVLLDQSLWEKSGHWDKFRDNMFMTDSENRAYAVKPMNCPGHLQVYNQGLKSYRDLPLRYSEFGFCHRNEPSGTLHGIMRIRGFVQDDGHVFCTEAQIASESQAFIEQVISVYKDFGFSDVIIKLATRPEKRIGDDAVWDKAEQALTEVLDEYGGDWKLSPGEGAFYGPKIEFSLRDSIGRVWQCGTLQVDFSMASRLDAYYIADTGEKKPPVMLHRAMLGSIERFIGILLEETGGDLPLWLAPIQVVVANITDEQAEYVKKVVEILKNNGFRAIYDLRNDKIGFKIREHSIARVPFVLIAGNKEIESNTVSVRTAAGEDLGSMSISKLIDDFLQSN